MLKVDVLFTARVLFAGLMAGVPTVLSLSTGGELFAAVVKPEELYESPNGPWQDVASMSRETDPTRGTA